MRCTAQKPKDQVVGCVDAEIAKLPWLPYYAYTWGGQSQCEGLASIFISITFDILALVCHAIGTIYLARRKGEPPPSFSFASMRGMVLTGFCKPIAEGFLLNAMSPAPGFSMGPYLLPFLRPTGFALAAFISGVWGSRGWGLMYLFMDGVVTMLTFFAFNLRIDIWKGPAVVPSLGSIVTAGSLPPPQLQTVYDGLFVATLPGALFIAAYFLAGLWPTMVLVGCCTRTWSLVKLGFMIWLTWVCFFLMIFAKPVPRHLGDGVEEMQQQGGEKVRAVPGSAVVRQMVSIVRASQAETCRRLWLLAVGFSPVRCLCRAVDGVGKPTAPGW
jgi:hypothetical protein